MKTEIVIARYNEDLSWLVDIPKSIKITIYNKGNDDIDKMNSIKNLKFTVIKLPNIGRESHTYLYHIINNYDKLAHRTIFCQGDSIFHSPGFINLLKNVKLFQPVQPLSAYYWPEGVEPFYFSNPPKPLLDKTTNLWIKNSPIHVEYLDNNFVTRYPYLYGQHHFVKLIELVKKIYNIENVFKFFVDRFLLKNVDLDDLFPVCYAGLFCINKEVILENSIDFYNNIMSMLIYELRYNTRYFKKNNIINNSTKYIDWGLFLEKLWLVIFNYKKHNKNYLKLKVKDFPIYNYQLTVRNNLIKFKFKSIVSLELYLNLTINNQLYSINISRNVIFLKSTNKTLLKSKPSENKNIQNILKNNTEIIVEIKLHNNSLIVSMNNIIFVDYHFKFNITNIENAKIFSIMNDNNFVDLLNNTKTNKKELEKYL